LRLPQDLQFDSHDSAVVLHTDAPIAQKHAPNHARASYVHCSRAARPLAEVEADVDGWLRLYGGVVAGVFVDEAPSEFGDPVRLWGGGAWWWGFERGGGEPDKPNQFTIPSPAPPQSTLPFMLSLVGRIRARGLAVALNPGTKMLDGGRLAPLADLVVAFEASHETWGGRWARYAPPGRRRSAAVIHSFAPAAADGRGSSGGDGGSSGSYRSQLSALLRDVQGRGYGWVYVTDAVAPDCYSRLPAHWAACVECVGEACGLSGRATGVGGVDGSSCLNGGGAAVEDDHGGGAVLATL
jgi:hypothetical protein